MIKRLLQDRAGHTAIEYSLIVLVAGIAIVAAVSAMGTSVNSMFTGLLTAFD